MNEDELRQAIALGCEQRGTEFKGPGNRTDKAFQVKVIRAILGMANKPNGGVVVIGVDDDGSTLRPTGLLPDDLATWSYDDMASNISEYADPYVDFHVEVVCMDSKSFVIISVSQFDGLPVICKRDYSGVLRRGALYVRRRGKNETLEVPSHVEMREILVLAAEALARDMVALHKKLLDHTHRHVEMKETSATRFDAEAEDLL